MLKMLCDGVIAGIQEWVQVQHVQQLQWVSRTVCFCMFTGLHQRQER